MRTNPVSLLPTSSPGAPGDDGWPSDTVAPFEPCQCGCVDRWRDGRGRWRCTHCERPAAITALNNGLRLLIHKESWRGR
jgi:hypothetical protein